MKRGIPVTIERMHVGLPTGFQKEFHGRNKATTACVMQRRVALLVARIWICWRKRVGEQQLDNLAVIHVRGEMQWSVGIRGTGVSVSASAVDQQLNNSFKAAVTCIMERRKSVGVRDIDANIRSKQQADNFNVAKHAGNVQRRQVVETLHCEIGFGINQCLEQHRVARVTHQVDWRKPIAAEHRVACTSREQALYGTAKQICNLLRGRRQWRRNG